MPIPFSDAEIALMRRLWNEEGKTAEQIACAIGRQFGIERSRSSICGRIARMPGQFRSRGKSLAATEAIQLRRMTGLRPKSEVSARPARSDDRPSSREVTRPAPDAPLRPGARLLADCEPRGCRFPVGEQDGQHFLCAAPVVPEEWRPGLVGGCYCRDHRRIAIRPREMAGRAA